MLIKPKATSPLGHFQQDKPIVTVTPDDIREAMAHPEAETPELAAKAEQAVAEAWAEMGAELMEAAVYDAVADIAQDADRRFHKAISEEASDA